MNLRRYTVGDAAHDLLFKLLEPDPAARAAHFEGGMDEVAVHAFFMQGTDMVGRCSLKPVETRIESAWS